MGAHPLHPSGLTQGSQSTDAVTPRFLSPSLLPLLCPHLTSFNPPSTPTLTPTAADSFDHKKFFQMVGLKKKSPDEVKKVFHILDKDKSGFIEEDELGYTGPQLGGRGPGVGMLASEFPSALPFCLPPSQKITRPDHWCFRKGQLIRLNDSHLILLME